MLTCLIQYTSMCHKLGLEAEINSWTKLEKLLIFAQKPTTEAPPDYSIIRRNAVVESILAVENDSIALAIKSENIESKLKLINEQHIHSAFELDSIFIKIYLNVLNERDLMESKDIFDIAAHYIFSKYNSNKVSETELLQVAELFVFIERYDLAYSLLQPRISLENPNLPLISLFTKLSYQNSIEFPATGYGKWLRTIHPLYPKNEWCSLFVGPCNISFQVFDDESVRDLYCDSCADFKNYAIEMLEEEDNEVK